jgi:cell division FtsZ-interacting protein ZapD
MLLPHAEMRTLLESVVVTLESISDTISHGIDRVKYFMTVSNEIVAQRLNHVNDLLLRASKKRDQVIEILGRRDVSPEMVDTILAELASDLHTVKNIFADDKWGDDDSLRAAETLMSALVGRVRSVNQIVHRDFTEKLKKTRQ